MNENSATGYRGTEDAKGFQDKSSPRQKAARTKSPRTKSARTGQNLQRQKLPGQPFPKYKGTRAIVPKGKWAKR